MSINNSIRENDIFDPLLLINTNNPYKIRKDIILNLKNCIRKLTEFSKISSASIIPVNKLAIDNQGAGRGAGKGRGRGLTGRGGIGSNTDKFIDNGQSRDKHINDNNFDGIDFCNTIEMALLYGIKSNDNTLWDYLDKLKDISDSNSLLLTETILEFNSNKYLINSLSKLRGWIRYNLNNKWLHDIIKIIAKNESKLNEKYYNIDSIINNQIDMNELLLLLKESNNLSFHFILNAENLNITPLWIEKLASIKSVIPLSNSSNKSTISSKGINSTSVPVVAKTGGWFTGLGASIAAVANKVIASINENEEKKNVQALIPTTSLNAPLFFNSNLEALILDEIRCKHAYLDPRLGIPTQALKMIHFLSNHLDTPNLFRKHISAVEIYQLQQILENEEDIPVDIDVNTVAQCLLKWLDGLDEPLLGYDLYDALHVCFGMEDNSHRIRNFSLLLQEIPWYSQPLLYQIILLLHKCTLPEYSSINGLNIISVSMLSSPFFLVQDNCLVKKFDNEEDAAMYNITETKKNCSLVQFLIDKHIEVFKNMNDNLNEFEKELNQKCMKINAYQYHVSNCFNIDSIGEDSYYTLLKDLYIELEIINYILTNKSKNNINIEDLSITDLQDDQVFKMFDNNNTLINQYWSVNCFGYLSIKSLLWFIKKYKEKSYNIIETLIKNRSNVCTLPRVITDLGQIVCENMMLVQSSNYTQFDVHLENISKQSCWELLDSEYCLEEVISISIIIFDDIFIHSIEDILLPNIELYEACIAFINKVLFELINISKSKTSEVILDKWTARKSAFINEFICMEKLKLKEIEERKFKKLKEVEENGLKGQKHGIDNIYNSTDNKELQNIDVNPLVKYENKKRSSNVPLSTQSMTLTIASQLECEDGKDVKLENKSIEEEEEEEEEDIDDKNINPMFKLKKDKEKKLKLKLEKGAEKAAEQAITELENSNINDDTKDINEIIEHPTIENKPKTEAGDLYDIYGSNNSDSTDDIKNESIVGGENIFIMHNLTIKRGKKTSKINPKSQSNSEVDFGDIYKNNNECSDNNAINYSGSDNGSIDNGNINKNNSNKMPGYLKNNGSNVLQNKNRVKNKN